MAPNGLPCPCMGCQGRSADCHGSCKRYSEWQAEVRKANEAVRAERRRDRYRFEDIEACIERRRKG